MLIRQIKCPNCKETLNSFYAYSVKCPVCLVPFSASEQKISNSGLKQLRQDKREFLKNTISRGQIKKLFNLSKEQLLEIPAANEFGLVRYYKVDVVAALHAKK